MTSLNSYYIRQKNKVAIKYISVPKCQIKLVWAAVFSVCYKGITQKLRQKPYLFEGNQYQREALTEILGSPMQVEKSARRVNVLK